MQPEGWNPIFGALATSSTTAYAPPKGAAKLQGQAVQPDAGSGGACGTGAPVAVAVAAAVLSRSNWKVLLAAVLVEDALGYRLQVGTTLLGVAHHRSECSCVVLRLKDPAITAAMLAGVSGTVLLSVTSAHCTNWNGYPAMIAELTGSLQAQVAALSHQPGRFRHKGPLSAAGLSARAHVKLQLAALLVSETPIQVEKSDLRPNSVFCAASSGRRRSSV